MRIRSIQYLRAVAALLVVVAHALLHPLNYMDPTYARLGDYGVLLFFVISGFIMVFTTGRGTFPPRDFLYRRIERIVPLYWLVTIGVSILAVYAPFLLKNTRFTWGQLVQSLLFIPFYRENGDLVPLMKLGWSLNYEMFFYCLFAAMALLRATTRVLLLTGLFLLLTLIGALIDFQEAIPRFYTAHVVLTFCVGMGIALLYQRRSDLIRGPVMTALWAILGIVFTLLGFAQPHDVPITIWVEIPLTLASASFLLLGLNIERRLPNSRIGIALGDASYAMYLTHMYFVAAIIVVLHKLTGELLPLLVTLASIALSVLGALFVHRYIERPITRWLRRNLAPAKRSEPVAQPVSG